MTRSHNSMQTGGRKLKEEEENPIDNVLVHLADEMCPLFRSMNYTANGITTLSLIMSCAAIYYLIMRDMIMFTLFFSLAYYFDVMDGHYARKYKMYSKFGDQYDHYKDLVVGVIIVGVLFDHYQLHNHRVVLILMIALGILLMLFEGCQEEIAHPDMSSGILGVFSHLVPREQCNEMIRWTRFFGPGTFQLGTLICCWYLYVKYIDKNTIQSIKWPF